MIRLAFPLIALTLISCASTPATGPLELAISDIYKDPWSYHGKKVRVRGTFDECISYTCQFCETEEALVALNEEYVRIDNLNDDEWSDLDDPRKMCMGVSFADETEIVKDISDKRHIATAQNKTDSLMEQLARFTTSTIDADYDASCSRVPIISGEDSNEDTIIVCSDRASQLERAKIVQTHIRRPATAGVINMYGLDILLTTNAETAAELTIAFHKAVSAFRKYEVGKKDPEFLFIVDDKDEWWRDSGISALGGACECEAENCQEDDWPKRFGDVSYDIPANPYTCWHAEEVNGVWRFPLQ